MANRLLVTKPLSLLAEEAADTEHGLKRALSATDLVMLGVGAIVGAGIFVLTGVTAAQHAGPAIVISFVLAAVACVFAGLCYAEMASMIPIAGSAYTYGYASLGEFIAWIIGWDLILEYSVGAATVAVGWSGYLVSLLRDIGITIPPQFVGATGARLVDIGGYNWQPLTAGLARDLLAVKGVDPSALPTTEALFQQVAALYPTAEGLLNLPAALIIALVTSLLVVGIRESANVNTAVVFLKVGVIVLFAIAGLVFLYKMGWAPLRENWDPFIPANTGEWGQYGWSGILRGASILFFAYIGFDAVSTAAQEAKNPKRDMPIGILGSLAICTLLYVIVSAVLTGVVSYQRLNVPDPIAVGIDATGMTWLSPLIKLAAIAGLGSVMLVMLLGQPRIFWTMSRDGLLPAVFGKVHPRFRTPYITTIVTGVAVGVAAAIFPIHELAELVSIGTLFAFTIVSFGILILRYTQPDAPRPFRVPFVPLVPLLGVATCFALMTFLPGRAWERLILWMVLGLVVYFVYGIRHSRIARARGQDRTD